MIRMSWTDVELVLDILKVHEEINDADDAIAADIHSGEIEFKNVSFTYDSKLAKKDQR